MPRSVIDGLAGPFSTEEVRDGSRPSSEPGVAALCRACVELADTAGPDADIGSQLSLLCRHVCDLVGSVDAAVVMEDGGTLRVVAASGPRPGLLEDVELGVVAGPVLECHRSGRAFLNVDLAHVPGEWDRFAVFARAIGYRVVSVVPLRFGERGLGVVVLADCERHPLTASQVGAVRLLVASTASAVAYLHAVDACDLTMRQLYQALRSRVVIEQAKGVVAERLHVSPGDAFELLRRFARNRGLSLRTVAGAAIDGELGMSELSPHPPRIVAGGHAGRQPGSGAVVPKQAAPRRPVRRIDRPPVGSAPRKGGSQCRT